MVPAQVPDYLAPQGPPGPLRWPLLRLLRPQQWIKNGFVLAALVFSGSFVHPAAVWNVLVTALLFCAASSAAYILNDLQDRESDRCHPVKCYTRPLASGAVSLPTARLILVVLYVLIAAACLARPRIGVVLVAYLLLNVSYSMWLKHMPILDIFSLAAGFVLRVMAGSAAIPVRTSAWMLVTTLCLALYLAATKRHQELLANGDAARGVLRLYSTALLDYYAQVTAISAIVFYGIFVATVRPKLALTVPVVLFGLFRYRYITEMLRAGESPTDAFSRDVPLLLTVVAWLGMCAYGVWAS